MTAPILARPIPPVPAGYEPASTYNPARVTFSRGYVNGSEVIHLARIPVTDAAGRLQPTETLCGRTGVGIAASYFADTWPRVVEQMRRRLQGGACTRCARRAEQLAAPTTVEV